MRDRSYLVMVVVLAVAMFAGLRMYLGIETASALAAASDGARPGDAGSAAGHAPRTIPRVAELLRQLKLVTVEVRADVESSRLDESWRGDVHASVTAPVRLYYGCDLSGVLGDGRAALGASLSRNILNDGYTLRVPRPVRLAAEVVGDDQQTSVQVGWGRFRDLAGEYQLGLARTGLYQEARALRLSPEQRRTVEQTTRDQLVALVRAFAAGGDPVPVDVVFVDAPVRDSPYASAPTDAESPGVGGTGQ